MMIAPLPALIRVMKWTNLSKPLVLENSNIDISKEMDQLTSASGFENKKVDVSYTSDQF